MKSILLPKFPLKPRNESKLRPHSFFFSTKMSAPRSSDPNSPAADSLPLLATNGNGNGNGRRSARGLSGVARFLRRASSRRLMRQPSVAVREAAAEHLEERQSDWAYSRPVVVLDILWNLAFVGAAAAVLMISRHERPSMPLRLWVLGYALQCVLHMVCVCIEYRRRNLQRRHVGDDDASGSGGRRSESNLSGYDAGQGQDGEQSSVAKHLESANTMFSFIWWIIGFYWVSAGGQALTHDAPQLYWLCIVFLAFDVVFVVFCVALACVIGIAVCCCLPCIIAVLYAVSDQEGASEEDVRQLPKYKFRRTVDSNKVGFDMSGPCGGIMTECGSDPPNERYLSAEDAECCICISSYEDGVELRQLPCGHHFHCSCIDKWLYINATCPLCKFNIIKNGNGREEV